MLVLATAGSAHATSAACERVSLDSGICTKLRRVLSASAPATARRSAPEPNYGDQTNNMHYNHIGGAVGLALATTVAD